METHARFWTTARIAGLGLALAAGCAGCHKTQAQDAGAPNGADPADVNLAQPDGNATIYAVDGAARATQPAQMTRVLAQRNVNEAQQQAQEYTPVQTAPIERRNPGGDSSGAYPGAGPQGYPPQGYPPQGYDPNSAQGGYDPNASGSQYADQSADEYAADLTAEAAAEPPPPLPVYDQPPCPDPDDLWTPGYWGWGPAGYYWVPGAWVSAPFAGALWTPGYWGFVGDRYRFHHGFWGLHIGFYGGINYGFGYTGYGYYGGYWRDRHFFYNTAVNRVNVNIVRNVYVHNVVVNNVVVNNRFDNRVSYNGGRGGVMIRPRPAEMAVLREQRIPPMQSQLAVRREAEGNRAQFYQENHGRPQNAVFTRPVAADRTLPAALPVAVRPLQNGYRGGDPRQAEQQPAVQGGRVPGPAGAVGGRDVQQPGGFQNRQYNRGQVQPNGQPQPGALVQPGAVQPGAVQPGGAAQPGAFVQRNGNWGGGNRQTQPGQLAQPAQQTQPVQQPQPAVPGTPARQPYQPNTPQENFRRGPAQPNPQLAPRVDNQPRPQPQFQQPPAAQAAPRVDNQPQPQYRTRQQYQPQPQQPSGPQPAPRMDNQVRYQGQPQVQQPRPQPQPQPQPQVQQQMQPRPQPQPQPQMQPRPQPQPQPQMQQPRPQQQMQPQGRPAPPRAEGPRPQERRD